MFCFVSQHMVPTEDPTVWYLDMASDALNVYDELISLYQAPPHHMVTWKSPQFSTNQIGSNKFRLVSSYALTNSD